MEIDRIRNNRISRGLCAFYITILNRFCENRIMDIGGRCRSHIHEYEFVRCCIAIKSRGLCGNITYRSDSICDNCRS